MEWVQALRPPIRLRDASSRWGGLQVARQVWARADVRGKNPRSSPLAPLTLARRGSAAPWPPGRLDAHLRLKRSEASPAHGPAGALGPPIRGAEFGKRGPESRVPSFIRSSRVDFPALYFTLWSCKGSQPGTESFAPAGTATLPSSTAAGLS